jgi:hypothetical protein
LKDAVLRGRVSPNDGGSSLKNEKRAVIDDELPPTTSWSWLPS